MTSYPITLPTSPNYREAHWQLRFNNTVFAGQNRTQQVVRRSGEMWQGEFTLPLMTAVNKQIWMAKLNSLAGVLGTFRQGDPAYTGPRGTAGGTPLVNGASQEGNSLITDAWSAAATFLAGDYFELDSYLYQLTEDCTADGSGNMTLVFEPSLRASPSNNAALTKADPKTNMRLTDDGVVVQELVEGWYQISFSAVEAL